MVIYPTIEEANRAEGTAINPRSEPSARVVEADWSTRLRGCGAPGGNRHGWLLTFHMVDQVDYLADSPGTLLAYEIVQGARAGRVAVLRRGWTSRQDARELERIRSLDGWDPLTPGTADLEWVDQNVEGEILFSVPGR